MEVECAGPRCRKRFEAQSKRARFCSSTCRSRARRAAAKVAAAGGVAEPESPAVGTPTVGGKRKSLPLVTAVTKELREAGRLESVDGQIAVLLAEQAAVATGSNAATLTKQLRHVLDRAVESGRPPAPDPEESGDEQDDSDEVTAARERREQKARAAAGRA